MPNGVIVSNAKDLRFRKINRCKTADSSFLGMTPFFQRTAEAQSSPAAGAAAMLHPRGMADSSFFVYGAFGAR
jgi:hypothetical protein